MSNRIDFLVEVQQVMRLNDKVIGEVSREYGINKTELEILIFLASNPDLDTAREIVEYRVMTKSCVSKAVDSLVRQGYLITREDEEDRRIIHLVIEERAGEVIELGLRAQRNMIAQIFKGISDEQLEIIREIQERITENTREALRLCGKN